MYQGFFALGGTEIANASRWMTYVAELVPGLDVRDCWDCADLGEVLGDGPYTSPAVDSAPWVQASNPDSWRFCGFYPLQVEGVEDGVRTAEVTELALDGAVVGAPRYGSREIRVTGLLAGADESAVTYGLRWLAKALEGSPCREGESCTGDHLCYYSGCPPMCSDSPALDDLDLDASGTGTPFYLCDDGMISDWARVCSVEFERTLYMVTLTSGPTITERFSPQHGAMVQVEFTLSAGVPFPYTTAISAVPGTTEIPSPSLADEVSCTPGSDVVVRTNWATNPVPLNAGGWVAGTGTGFTVERDATISRLDGDASVRMTRTEVGVLANLATNSGPRGSLDGWAWQLGSGAIGGTDAAVDVVLDTSGDGPGGSASYFKATVVEPKVGGEDGPTYTLAASEGTYTAQLWVRASTSTSVYLQVTAIDSTGQVVATAVGPTRVLLTDTWGELGPVTVVAPASTVRLRVAVLMPSTSILPAGQTLSAGTLEVYAGPYTSGTFLGALTYVGQHDSANTTIQVEPGALVTASLYVGATVNSTARLTLAFYNASGLMVGSAQSAGGVQVRAAGVTGVAQWVRTWVTATTPATAEYVVVGLRVDTVGRGADVDDMAWATSLLVEHVGAPMTYFDGTSTGGDRMTYGWSGTAHASTSTAVLSIPEAVGPLLDPDCATIDPPPRPPTIAISCVETPTEWRRYEVTVPEDLVPTWFDAVPVVRLSTGDSAVKQVRVRFYPNPLGAPVQALDPCDYCGEFVVTYIPANSTMTLDGIRQWVSVVDADGLTRTANHLLASSDGGPVSWPLLGCGVGYTLVVDVAPATVVDLSPQVCLAARA